MYDASERIVRSLEGAADRGTKKTLPSRPKNFRSAWKLIGWRPGCCD
jgi:hypothetical protein